MEEQRSKMSGTQLAMGEVPPDWRTVAEHWRAAVQRESEAVAAEAVAAELQNRANEAWRESTAARKAASHAMGIATRMVTVYCESHRKGDPDAR